jgi:hypothetical protein
MTPLVVLREEKSLTKVYEKKLIFCFISICQAENRPRRRIQQSGTVTETKDVVAIGALVKRLPPHRRESEDIVLTLQTMLWR